MLEPSKRCFYAIMANYNGSLEAVERHIHSVRYDMAVNRDSGGHPKLDLIRAFVVAYILNDIATKYIGPLEVLDCFIHTVRYDMVLECCWRPSQIGPHQVTYDAVAWLTHIHRALVVAYILTFYDIASKYIRPLEALVDFIRTVRYDMVVERGSVGHPKLYCIRSPTRLYHG
eukprot:scaffold9606_cov105-Skeletonema_marinoi.AAC.2